MRRISAVSALVALALLAGACGGSSKPATSAKGPNPAQDKKTAQAVSLRPGDLPASFQSSPQTLGPKVEAANRRLYTTCLHKPYPPDHASAVVNSPSFTQGLAESAASTVEVTDTAAQAQQDFATITSPQFVTCSEQNFPSSFAATAPPGATASGFRVVSERPPVTASGSAAYRLTATVHMGPSITVPLTVDRVYVVKNRTEVVLTFTNVGTPFPATLESQVLTKVLARM